jgi:hypothetical protein
MKYGIMMVILLVTIPGCCLRRKRPKSIPPRKERTHATPLSYYEEPYEEAENKDMSSKITVTSC